MRKLLVFVFCLVAISSCTPEKMINIETQAYKMVFREVPACCEDITNKTGYYPLINVKAERMQLKEILGVLLNTDTSKIIFEPANQGLKFYQAEITQLMEKENVGLEMAEALLNNLDLDLTIHEVRFFKISIQDSLQYRTHLSLSENGLRQVVNTPDSIKITNGTEQDLITALNNSFSDVFVASSRFSSVDFNWPKKDFDQLRPILESQLGLKFEELKKSRLEYTIH